MWVSQGIQAQSNSYVWVVIVVEKWDQDAEYKLDF